MKVSVASGGFDPLHSGHIQYLKASAKIGHHLVVALNSDDWLIAKKGKNFLLNAKFFILACGGIENSRILLWTRVNNRSLIDENLPIGKYWMTHPWFLGGVGFLKKKKLKDILKNDFLEYSGPIHIATSKKIVNDYKILSGALYMNADEDNKIYKEIIKDFLCISPVYGKKIARYLFKKDLKCGDIFMNIEELPNVNNRIELDKRLLKIKNPK